MVGVEDTRSSALLAQELPGLAGVTNILVGSYDNPSWLGPMGFLCTGGASDGVVE